MMKRLLYITLAALVSASAMGQQGSRDFDGTDSLTGGVASALNDHTFTAACWVAPDASFATDYVVSFGDSSVTNEYVALGFGVGVGNIQGDLEVVTTATGTINATTSSASDNVDWYMVYGIGVSSSSRSVQLWKEGNYTSAWSGSDNTLMSAPGTYDQTTIGETADSSPSNAFDGKIAWCALWDVSLGTTGANNRLGIGTSPTVLRPQSLVGFWRMDQSGTSAANDHSQNSNNLTTTDTMNTATDSPPIFWPRGGN